MAFRFGVFRGRASMLMGGALAGKTLAQAGAGAGKDCCNALKAKIAELEKELQNKKFQLASMAAKVAELEGDLESRSKRGVSLKSRGSRGIGQRKAGLGKSRLAAAKASRGVGSKRSSLKARRLASSRSSKPAASRAKGLNAKRFSSLKPSGAASRKAAATTVNAGRLFGKNTQGKSLGLRRSAKNLAAAAPVAKPAGKGALVARRLAR